MAYNQRNKKKKPNGFVELIEYIIEEIKKRNAQKYVITAGIGVVLLIAVVIIVNSANKESSSAEPSSDDVIIASDTSGESTEEEAVNPLEKDAYPEINKLFETYFKALIESDTETFNKIVDSDADVTEDQMKTKTEFIENYQNIACYTKKGLVEDTFIVFVYFEVKFPKIETPAPSLMWRSVRLDENGDPYIDEKTLAEKDTEGEAQAYLQEILRSEEVLALSDDVNKKLEEAQKEDEALADLMDYIVKASKGTTAADDQEESGESTEAEDETTEETTKETTKAESTTAETTESD